MTNFRLSFKITSAALLIKSPVLPIAILDIVLIEQGAIIKPALENEPEEIKAPILPRERTSCAKEII